MASPKKKGKKEEIKGYINYGKSGKFNSKSSEDVRSVFIVSSWSYSLFFDMFFKVAVITLALLAPSFCFRRFHQHGKPMKLQVQQDINEGIGHFGVNLHKVAMKHFYNNGDNVLLSPIGTYFSLALTHLAASGSTRDELRNVMGLPSDDQMILRSHQSLGELYRRLSHNVNANVTVYNGLFVQKGNQIKDVFKDQIKKFYDSYVTSVDFSHSEATAAINRWFNDKTNGKISQFYDHDLPTDTKLVLANALSFGATWHRSFPEEYTKDDVFRTEDGHEEQISMLHKTDNVPYYVTQDAQYEVIGIPYKNNEYIMYVLLPHESVSLKDVMDNFTYEDIQKIVQHSTLQTIDIKFPHLHVKGNQQLKEILQEMGVHILFDSPDLSNMITQAQLKVSQMWHHVEIDIHEQGSDISAGTTQEYKIYDEFVPNEEVKPFYVQRPYMFFIYHPNTKTVLFYGSIFKTGGQ